MVCCRRRLSGDSGAGLLRRRFSPSAVRSLAILLVLLLRYAFGADPLDAQPFSTLTVSAGPTTDVAIGRLDDYWEADRGGYLRIAAPFHLGGVALALQRTSYSAKTSEQPDFRVISAMVEWNATLELPHRAGAFGGIHAGSAAMSFADNDDILGNENESEFLAGIQAGVFVPVAGPLALTIAGAHRRIFTRIPMRLTSLSAGLQITFRTPGRLRSILE